MTNWADPGRVTSKAISERKDAPGWITSPVMQMGLDELDAEVVILVRPPTRIEDFLQSWGRGGRRGADGKTSRVLCICLFNMEDISASVKGMTREVREFCLETGCLRQKLMKIFNADVTMLGVDSTWCCGPCSGL